MKYEVKMPSLGADMDQGKLMEWRIRPGDQVKKGQTIAVVETTKSAVEIESFRDGKVLELIGEIGQSILVGRPIAYFEVEGTPLEIEKEIKKEIIKKTGPEAEEEKRVRISPAAWKYAQEQNVGLKDLIGSGPHGEIELKDVEAALDKRKASASIVNLREAIGRAMSLSKKEIPHYYLKNRMSLDVFMKWLDEHNQTALPQARLLPAVAMIRAIILSLKESKSMNGHYVNGHFNASESIHLGIAMALKTGGVMVPAMLDADRPTLDELQTSFMDLANRTQKKELKNRELTEGTFTITNLGDLGVDEVYGVIFPPQVAMLGLGRIHKAGIVDGNIIRPGWVVDVTLSADHRVSDGMEGARFLRKLEEYLLHPELLGEI